MTSAKHDAQLAASAESSAADPRRPEFLQADRGHRPVELQKLFRDPTEVAGARRAADSVAGHLRPSLQPRARHPHRQRQLSGAFMTPGILAQSVLFAAIFYGIAIIWERDLGIVHKLLVSPAQRSRSFSAKPFPRDFAA